jgi:hypothetical protein
VSKFFPRLHFARANGQFGDGIAATVWLGLSINKHYQEFIRRRV